MKRLLTLLFLLGGLFCNAKTVQITFYSPSIVRVQKALDGNIYDKASLSVTMQPQPLKVSYSQQKLNDNTVVDIYKTEKLTVTVLDDGVMFKDNKGNVILSELVSDKLKQSFSIDKDEPIYGLGILQEGRMDLRGTDRRMIQGNTDDYCNIIQSIKGYGIFWDNYSPTTFHSSETSFSFDSEVGDGIDYYFIYGGDADGVIAGNPIAMSEGLRFAIREGGRTVGAGVVSKILK